MSTGLPQKVDVRRYADTQRHLQGLIPAQQLSRLTGLVESVDGEVQVDLRFFRDDQRIAQITGKASASINMVCQRCLEPVQLELNCEIKLGGVYTELAADKLPDSLEPLLLTDEPVSLAELVEDELLLTLPVVALHENCEAPENPFSDAPEEADEQKENPFAVLKDLKL